jgi:isoleucyl-tRNA synthetase
MVNKYGADVLRWYFFTVNDPGEPKRFDEQDLAKTFRKNFLILHNCFSFYEQYGDKSVQSSKFKVQSFGVLNRWILARLHQTIERATKDFDAFEIGKAAKVIEELIDDLSRWYIRRSRPVFQEAAREVNRKAQSAKREWQTSSVVLRNVLTELSKLMASFAPFFAEALYKSLKQEVGSMNYESVHLTDWPKTDKKLLDKKLLEQMAEARRLVALALAEREKAGIKVRQPLSELRIRNYELGKNAELVEVIKEEVNVKSVAFDKNLKAEVELDTQLTPELRNEGFLRELVRAVQGLRHDANYQMEDKIQLFAELPMELLEVARAQQAELSKLANLRAVEFKKTDKPARPGGGFDAELKTKIGESEVWLGLKK